MYGQESIASKSSVWLHRERRGLRTPNFSLSNAKPTLGLPKGIEAIWEQNGIFKKSHPYKYSCPSSIHWGLVQGLPPQQIPQSMDAHVPYIKWPSRPSLSKDAEPMDTEPVDAEAADAECWLLYSGFSVSRCFRTHRQGKPQAEVCLSRSFWAIG